MNKGSLFLDLSDPNRINITGTSVVSYEDFEKGLEENDKEYAQIYYSALTCAQVIVLFLQAHKIVDKDLKDIFLYNVCSMVNEINGHGEVVEVSGAVN